MFGYLRKQGCVKHFNNCRPPPPPPKKKLQSAKQKVCLADHVTTGFSPYWFWISLGAVRLKLLSRGEVTQFLCFVLMNASSGFVNLCTKIKSREYPGGPVLRTSHFDCRGCRFNCLLGKIAQARQQKSNQKDERFKSKLWNGHKMFKWVTCWPWSL